MVNVDDLSTESLRKILERREAEENKPKFTIESTPRGGQKLVYKGDTCFLGFEETDLEEITDLETGQTIAIAVLNQETLPSNYFFEIEENTDKSRIWINIRRKG